jgi:hypothetical protein
LPPMPRRIRRLALVLVAAIVVVIGGGFVTVK